MIEQLRAYYLIRGTVVQVVMEDKSSGLSQVNMAGIMTNLWTLIKFSMQPFKDIIGHIETPTTSGPAPTPAISATTAGESPTPIGVNLIVLTTDLIPR